MSLFSYICLLIFIFYMVLLIRYLAGWIMTKETKPNQTDSIPNNIFVSVLVAFRNEEENLPFLLKSLEKQNYPKNQFEIILIDDHSEDNSINIIEDHIKQSKTSAHLIKNTTNELGKKAALKKGIEEASGELILQTDADCLLPKKWIGSFVSYYQKYQPLLLLAPVKLTNGKGFLASFQKIENVALMAVTGGSCYYKNPVLANGANMGYSKKTWLIYQDSDFQNIPSGDDMFLLQSVSNDDPAEIYFLKTPHAIVKTPVSNTFKQFWNQRKRWMQKSKYYNNTRIILSSLIIFSGNLFVLAAFIDALINSSWSAFFIIFLMKIALDTVIVLKVNSFLKSKIPLFHLMLVNIIYSIYTFLLAFSGSFGKIEWKNREIK